MEVGATRLMTSRTFWVWLGSALLMSIVLSVKM